jgi:succinyl-CoA synthetase beta subunit
MKIHEYQGKEILKRYGVAVPRGVACFSVDEAIAAADKLGGPVWVVKAQVHAGGRGKGGGVKLARSLDEVRQRASEILGMQLVTHQTGPAGQKVRRLLVEEGFGYHMDDYSDDFPFWDVVETAQGPYFDIVYDSKEMIWYLVLEVESNLFFND